MHRRLILSALASGLTAAAFPGMADAAKQNRMRYQGAEQVYLTIMSSRARSSSIPAGAPFFIR